MKYEIVKLFYTLNTGELQDNVVNVNGVGWFVIAGTKFFHGPFGSYSDAEGFKIRLDKAAIL